MGAVQLNTVESGEDRPACRSGEILDDRLDLGLRETSRDRRAVRSVAVARPQHVAAGDELRDGLHPGVEDLEHSGSAAAPGGVRETAQAGQEAIVAGREFPGEADPRGAHVGAACDDQAHAADTAPIVSLLVRRDGSVVFGGPCGHGGHDDAIAQCQAWREDVGLESGLRGHGSHC